MNNKIAVNKIQELEQAKRGLELEVHVNKKRLEMETLAAREVNFKKRNIKPSILSYQLDSVL